MKKKMITVICAIAVSAVLMIPAYASKIRVKKVEISPSSCTVRINQTRSLSTMIYPYNAADQEVVWESANYDIVSVDGEGDITGISPGTTEITATVEDGKVGVCTVTVPGYVLKSIELDTDTASQPGVEFNTGEELSAITLRSEVEKTLRGTAKGSRQTITFYDKTIVSTAALRAAAFTAEYEGGQVSLRFITTLEGAPAQGQITVAPTLAGKEDYNINPAVFCDAANTGSVKDAASAHYGGDVAVVYLPHHGSFGMPVQVAAKVAISGEDPGKIQLSSYDPATGAYTELNDQACQFDDSGYIHFTVNNGGYIVLSATA